MGLKRRHVRPSDPSAWVFNRMAQVYDARPPYPEELVTALSERARGGTIVDVGAGIGHLALPLAARGQPVVAVEPAEEMLRRLEESARIRGLEIQPEHAAAEALPLPDRSAALVIVADALHFLDRERAAAEIARVLAPRGALAVITVELGDTPFMEAVRAAMASASPRRPREVGDAVEQLARLCGVRLEAPRTFSDDTPLDPSGLQRLLRSISFLGPALNAARWATFVADVERHEGPRVWSRYVTLHAGSRR
jgi:ubiquinone/menaquinone biosynthesis C-methylase UbiE